ncbi:putative metalloendopeptidase, M23 family [Cupriavidus taiwanensis]|uniref:M23 family metallopeptidase n=1 Tax=Cupriavidus taiwanensis TaxID=164546 RepID=UPI000E1A1774|nr:M23 family metallopeptidase [Cupriavidus taiwanensis]SPA30916.1 putative metalloendopeptidase, M23 family [Cupriavidus taiwanensis]
MAASRLVPPLLALVRRLAWLVLWIGLGWLAWPWLQPPLERAIYAARLSARPAPATLPMPVTGVAPGALRDTWHGARSGGRKHEGIDIFAPRGREVVSATDGIVTRVGTNQLGGNVVWVMGPGRQMHYYAHLDRYAGVRAGDIIAAGTVLGYVGTTGNARGTPPHLHYGIYTAGGAINPYPLLKPSMAAGAR